MNDVIAGDTVLGSAEFWSATLTVLLIASGLLICARLAALLVGPNARTGMSDRDWLWRAWSGFGLLALAAAAWSGFSRGHGTAPQRMIISILAVSTAAFLATLCDLARHRITGRQWWIVAAGCIVVDACVVLFASHDGRSGYPSLAVGTALGLYYFGYVGLGQRLRIGLKVIGADGKEQPTGVAYVASRVETMGSHRPRGLRAPQGADVMQLPSEAISALPATEGKVVATLLSVLRAVTSVNPWQAQVVIVDDSTVTVELSRNGRSADSTLITRAALGLKNKSRQAIPDPSATHELLTAAAAFLLIRLSERHQLLAVGLCGTTKWRSLACQVLAGTEPYAREDQEQLFTVAVEKDRKNDAARLGYLYYRSGDLVGTSKNEQAYVGRLDAFCNHLWQLQEQGYEALRLRAKLVLVNARLNYILALKREISTGRHAAQLQPHSVVAEKKREWETQKGCAIDECAHLLSTVRRLTDGGKLPNHPVTTPRDRLAEFANDMEIMVRIYQAAALGKPADLEGELLTPSEWYAEACAEVGARSGNYLKAALDLLDLALGSEDLRQGAPSDPSLEPLIKARPAEFMTLVDKQSLSDVAAFTPYRDQLNKGGMRFTGELLNRSEGKNNAEALAISLGVPVSTVSWMRDVCRIIDSCPDRTQAIPWTNLLTQEGVETIAAMGSVLHDKVEQARLEKLAWKTNGKPLTVRELRAWAGNLSDHRRRRGVRTHLHGH
ncbi:hypothetical protein [Streptomyces sp. NPDC088766]|uniref:hypothetical protein n=1 Tax=Streptomyces sp. NPDC088766 TaxID=3365893 RepID=UPI00380E2A0C